MRSNVTPAISIAMRGLWLRIVSKSALPISSTVHSVVVRTVAERGTFWIKAISPTRSPLPPTRSTRSPSSSLICCVIRMLPSAMM